MYFSKQQAVLIVAWCLTSSVSGFAPFMRNIRSESPSTRLHQQNQSAEKEKRKPWDVLRFVQQSSKFVSLPFVPSSKASKQRVQPGQVLWQPASSSSNKNKKQPFQWAPLDDVVMGGASQSDLDNNSGLWKGLVTDANNGGFVGIRTTPNNLQLDLTNCRGLEWTFQTSPQMPRRLKVVLRDSTDFNGIAWTTSVDIPNNTLLGNKNQQVKVKLPLNSKSLVPTKFARIINDASVQGGIDKTSITALQLVYSKFEYEGALNPKFQAGDFDLQLLEVKAY